MAKKKTSRSLSSTRARRTDVPAAWFRALKPEQRERQRLYMVTTVKLLRQFHEGFDASDGYDLRHPERFSFQRMKTIAKYGQQIHVLTSSPYYRAVARTDEQRDVLKKYTNQVSGGTKPRRAFVVHHPEAAYRDIKIKVNKAGRVTLTRKMPGVVTRSQIFLFVDYGFNPRTFVSVDDVKEAVSAMIETGDLPEEGHYQLESDLHGAIWFTMERDDIVLNLDSTIRDSSARSPSFSKGLLGLRYYTDEFDADILDAEKTRRLEERKKAREKYRHVHEGRAMFGRWSDKYYDKLFKKPKKKKRKKEKRKKTTRKSK